MERICRKKLVLSTTTSTSTSTTTPTPAPTPPPTPTPTPRPTPTPTGQNGTSRSENQRPSQTVYGPPAGLRWQTGWIMSWECVLRYLMAWIFVFWGVHHAKHSRRSLGPHVIQHASNRRTQDWFPEFQFARANLQYVQCPHGPLHGQNSAAVACPCCKTSFHIVPLSRSWQTFVTNISPSPLSSLAIWKIDKDGTKGTIDTFQGKKANLNCRICVLLLDMLVVS